MSTDLHKVQDHPTNILNSYAADAFRKDYNSRYGSAYATSATRLHSYEIEHGVTFAALDNDALEAVVETYNGGEIEEIEAFVRSVRDLLGLDD